MQNLMRYLTATLFVIICLPFFLSAETDLELDITAGGGWDSNIARSISENREITGDGQAAGFISWDISAMLAGESWSLDYALYSDIYPLFNTYSRLDNELSFSLYNGKGDFEFTETATLHYSAVNFSDIHSFAVDASIYLDAVYLHSDFFNTFLTLSGIYRHGIAGEIEYLRGPAVALEFGEYFYIDGEKDYIKLSWRGKYAGFRNDSLGFVKDGMELKVYDVCNKTFENRVRAAWKMFLKEHSMLLSVSYINTLWLEKDLFDYFKDSEKLVKKRRIDSTLSFSGEFSFALWKNLSFILKYEGLKNFSTFGEDNEDYADWNYWRHVASGELNYVF